MALEDEEAQDALDAADAKEAGGGGFNPAAYIAATAPRAPAQRPAFDPAAYAAATAPAATTAAPADEPGVGEALVRGAAQGATFGFADELTGALKAAFTDESYASARDKARAAYAAANASHPIAYGAGELAGGVASTLVPTGAAFKAVGLGAKAAEGAEALSGAARAVHDVGAGAAVGAANAAGSSEAGIDSKAGGFGQLAADTIRGAAAGGATNAVLAPLARTLVAGAPKRATADLMEAVTGNAPAKFAKKVAADAKDIESTLFLPENKAILENLGNTEKLLPLTESRMEVVGSKLDALKTELDDELSTTVYKAGGIEKSGGNGLARAGGVEAAGPGEAAAQRARLAKSPGNAGELGAADETALTRQDRIAERPGAEYSPPPGAADYRPPPTTVDGRAVPKVIDLTPQEVLGGARLGDIVEPIESRIAALEKQPGNGAEKRALREMLEDVKDSWSPRVKGRPAYDPDQIVSTRDLRAYTTQAQKLASNTIGTINESLASELKHDLSATVTKIMNDHLDRAAAASPRAAEIVAQMRRFNTEYSALANMNDAFRGNAWKEITKRKSASALLGEGAHKIGLTGAAVALATGHPLGAAAGVGAPLAAKALDKIATSGNRWLATVYRAAAAGSTKDQLIKLAVEQGAPAAIARYVAGRLAS